MYCYNLYSLLRPVNNLSLRVEGRGKLEDCFGGGTKGDQWEGCLNGLKLKLLRRKRRDRGTLPAMDERRGPRSPQGPHFSLSQNV